MVEPPLKRKLNEEINQDIDEKSVEQNAALILLDINNKKLDKKDAMDLHEQQRKMLEK